MQKPFAFSCLEVNTSHRPLHSFDLKGGGFGRLSDGDTVQDSACALSECQFQVDFLASKSQGSKTSRRIKNVRISFAEFSRLTGHKATIALGHPVGTESHS